MGDMSGEDYYLNKHTISQQYCDSNNGDVSSGCIFQTATLYPMEKIQVRLKIFRMMLKSVMMI